MRRDFFGSNILFFATLVFSLLVFGGCGSDSSDPFAGKIDTSYLGDYLSGEVDNNSSEGISVYMDMSEGVYYGVDLANNSGLLKRILNKLESRKIEIKVLRDGIISRYDKEFKELYTPESYQEPLAPIDAALDTICKRNENALLITDFELYKAGQVLPDNNAFGKQFKSWVNNGNRLDIYYFDETYEDQSSSSKGKRLFFMAFSLANDNSMNTIINQAIEVHGTEPKRLTIDARSWKVEPQYSSAGDVGLVKQKEQWNSFFDKDGSMRGEKYEIIALKNRGIASKLTSDKESGQYEPNFIDNLFIDFEASEVFELEDLKVKVSDISQDYEAFCKSAIAIAEGEKIKMIKNDKKADVWSPETNGNRLIQECFEKDSKNLRSAYIYTSKEGREILEFLAIDKDVLKNTINGNPKKAQIRLNFHENFDPKKFEEFKLFKIEIFVGKVNPNIELAKSFVWDYKEKKNELFSNGIEDVIQNAKVEDQVLYTIYLVDSNTYK